MSCETRRGYDMTWRVYYGLLPFGFWTYYGLLPCGR